MDSKPELRADGGVGLADADLPTPEEAIEKQEGGGRAVSTQAECNGCDVTAPVSELPDGEHDFATVETVDSEPSHTTTVHVCGNCGTISATIITSEENVPKIRAALENGDSDE